MGLGGVEWERHLDHPNGLVIWKHQSNRVASDQPQQWKLGAQASVRYDRIAARVPPAFLSRAGTAQAVAAAAAQRGKRRAQGAAARWVALYVLCHLSSARAAEQAPISAICLNANDAPRAASCMRLNYICPQCAARPSRSKCRCSACSRPAPRASPLGPSAHSCVCVSIPW